ncbi:uncharacterized protein LOC123676374 [Harmonia axyridis]|uniref:uncharacterized protein LOC123676374 n=1 Tax=Harmonia axyridis TaxID=115357 RepID=UPI001E2792B9|nr:uncharacterized protein LOC123676374 [Harmonia axyridis]
MKSRNVFIFLSVFTCVISADVDRELIVAECAQQNGLSEEDLEKWINYQKNSEEKFLCFMLCCHQKDRSLDMDGKWDQKFLSQHLNDMYLINNTLKTQVMECFANIPPIRTCLDMKLIEKCIPAMKIRNCPDEYGINQQDIGNFTKNPSEPSEKMLCYLKCSSENDDLIFEDGTLNMNFLKELIDRMDDMKEEEKNSVEECLSKVPPVKSCRDFLPFAKCVQNMNLF